MLQLLPYALQLAGIWCVLHSITLLVCIAFSLLLVTLLVCIAFHVGVLHSRYFVGVYCILVTLLVCIEFSLLCWCVLHSRWCVLHSR